MQENVGVMTQRDLELRVQEIVKLQIGDLVLTAAAQKAELEVLRAEVARLAAPPPEPPRDPQ